MKYPATWEEYKAQKQNRQAAGDSTAASGGSSRPATWEEYKAQKQAQKAAQTNMARSRRPAAEIDRMRGTAYSAEEKEKCLNASGFEAMQTDMQGLFGTMDNYFSTYHKIGASSKWQKDQVNKMLTSVAQERNYFSRYADVLGDTTGYNEALSQWEKRLKQYQAALDGKESDEDSLALGAGMARLEAETNQFLENMGKAPTAGTAVAQRANEMADGVQQLMRQAQEIEDYLKAKKTPAANTLLQRMSKYRKQLEEMQKDAQAGQMTNPLTGKPMGAELTGGMVLPRYTKDGGLTLGYGSKLDELQGQRQNEELSSGLLRKAEKADWENQTVQQHREYILDDLNRVADGMIDGIIGTNGKDFDPEASIYKSALEEVAARLNYLMLSGKCTEEEFAQLMDEVDEVKKKFNGMRQGGVGAAERAYKEFEIIPSKDDAMKEFRYQSTGYHARKENGEYDWEKETGYPTRENIPYKSVDDLLTWIPSTAAGYNGHAWGFTEVESAAKTFIRTELLPEYLANVPMTQEQYDAYMKAIQVAPNAEALRATREANGLNGNEQGMQNALGMYKEIDAGTYAKMAGSGIVHGAENVATKYPGGINQVFHRGIGYLTRGMGSVLNLFGLAENSLGNRFVKDGQEWVEYEDEDWQAGKQREYEEGRYASELTQNGSKFAQWTANMTRGLTQAALEMAAAGAVAGQISAGNAALTQLSSGGKYASSLANAQKAADGYTKFAGQMANLMRNSSNLIISVNAALNSYGEAEDSGMDAPGRAVKLIAGGLIEYYTNGLFGGNPVVDPDGAGAVAKYIYKLTDNETIRKIVSSKVFDRLGEGMEEVTSAIAGAALDYALTGETNLSAEELVNEFTVGVLLSMVMSAPEDIVDLTARAKNYVKARTITRFGANAQTNLDVLYGTMAAYATEYLAGDESLMRFSGWSESEIKRAKSEWQTITREFNTLADRLEGMQNISESFERYAPPEGVKNDGFVDEEFESTIRANQRSEAALMTDRALDIAIISTRAQIDALRGSTDAQDVYFAESTQKYLDILDGEKSGRKAEKASAEAERAAQKAQEAARAAESATQEQTPPEAKTQQETQQTAQEATSAQESAQQTTQETVQQPAQEAVKQTVQETAQEAAQGKNNTGSVTETTAPESGVQTNEGGNNNEQQPSISESEERNVRVDSARQAGSVDESTGTADRRTDTGAAENGRGTERENLRRQKLNERVERFKNLPRNKRMDALTADGDPNVLVGVVPVRSYTKEMQKVQREAKERGLKTTFVVGTMSVKGEDGEYRNVDAIYDKEAGRIIASVSSAMFEPEQLVEHEAFHDRIAKQEIDLAAATEAAFRDVTPEEAEEISEQYTDLYNGVYDDIMAIYEEILADAAAGMNRFANAKFEPVIQAVQQLVTETESRAPDAQISEATRRTPPEDEKTAPKGGTKASMAGKKAKTASSKNLALAEAMEEDGASREEIWQKTGWLRGADGQWRFEIDDSKAVFRANGDAKLLSESRYRRLEELTDKWGDSFEKGGEALTEAEEAEMEALQEEYSDRVWEKKYELQDFLKHDELYEAYPLLRHTSVRFEKLDPGVKGKFDKRSNTIVLSDTLFGKGPETLLHEIQHIIQKYEGFQGGTSPEYWARKDYESDDHELDRLQEEYSQILNSLDRDEQNDYIRYQEIDGELEKLFYSDKPGDAEKYDRLDAEHDELYTKLYGNEWFTRLLDLKRQMDNPSEIYLRQYLNSAGEIEARETASRRSMTAEERRNNLPDLGWDRALMTDDGGSGYKRDIRYALSPAEKAQRAQEKAEAAIAKAEDAKKAEQESYRKELTRGVKKLFEVQNYDNDALSKLLEAPMAEMQQGITLLQSEKDDLYEKLLDLGTLVMPADEYYEEIRSELRGRRIFVPQGIRREMGDDWNAFKKRAFGQKIYLTSEESDGGADVHMLELAEMYPGTFTEEYDTVEMLRQIVNTAEKGASERMSLREGMKVNEKRYGLTEQEQDEYQKGEFLKLLNKYAEQAGREARETQNAFETDERLQSLIREADEAAGVKPKAVTEPWTISEAEAQKRGFPYLNGRQVYPLRTWVKAADMDNYGLVLDKSTKKGMLTVLFTNKETGLSTVKDIETKLLTAVDAKYQPSTTETAALLASMPQEKLEDAVDAQDLAEFYEWYDGQTQGRQTDDLRPVEEERAQRAREKAQELESERGESAVQAAEEAEKRMQEQRDAMWTGMAENMGINVMRKHGMFYDKANPMCSYQTKLKPKEAIELLETATSRVWKLQNLNDGTWIAKQTAKKAHRTGMSPDEAAERIKAEEVTAEDRIKAIRNGNNEVFFDGVPIEDFKGSPAMEKMGIKIHGAIVNFQNAPEILADAEGRYNADERIKRYIKEKNPYPEEVLLAQDIAYGRATMEDIEEGMLYSTIKELSDMYINQRMTGENLLLKRRRAVDRVTIEMAAESIPTELEIQADPEKFHNMRLSRMNLTRPEILMPRLFGDERGDELNERYIYDTQGNTAESDRWITEQSKKFWKFKDKAGEMRNLTEEEAKWVQVMLDTNGVDDWVKKNRRGKEILEALNQVKDGKDAEKLAKDKEFTQTQTNLFFDMLARKQAEADASIDKTITKAAAEAYRKFYDDIHPAINELLAAYGMEPIGRITDYTPHMRLNEKLSGLEKILSAFGLENFNTAEELHTLPTEIVGQTQEFKPKKVWIANFMRRNTGKTDYNIVAATRKYIDSMADLFFHTNDIVKMRGLEKYLHAGATRNTKATLDELFEAEREMRLPEKITWLRNRGVLKDRVASDITEQEVQEEFDQMIEEAVAENKHSTRYSNFAQWVTNYTNILANKQYGGDRGMEYDGGREAMNTGNKLVGLYGTSMVAGNLSSGFAQVAQVAQIISEKKRIAIAMALRDMVIPHRLDAFKLESNFLTTRRGAEFVPKGKGEKTLDVMYHFIGCVDMCVATLAARSGYIEAVMNGKSYKEAMRESDRYASRVMGNRAKGSRANAFYAKSTGKRILHQFSEENLASMDGFFYSLGRDFRDTVRKKGRKAALAKLIGRILAYLTMAFIINRLTDDWYGGTPIPLDIGGITANFVASGKGLPTNDYLKGVINKVMKGITGKELFDDVPEESENFDTWAALDTTLGNIVDDIPMASNFSAIIGAGDRNMPITELINRVKNVPATVKENGLISGDSAEAIAKLAALLVPGGNQLQKTGFGIKALVQGGKMQGYGEKRKLRYAIDTEDAGSVIRALLFGVNATHEAKRYYATGDYAGLSAEQTEVWDELREEGVNGYALYGLMMRMEDAGMAIEVPQENAEDGEIARAREARKRAARAELLKDETLTDAQKSEVYSVMVEKGNDEKIDRLLAAGMKWKDISELLDKRGELSAGEDAKNWGADFASWVDGKNYSAKQKETIDEALMPSSADFYRKMTAAGVSKSNAMTLEKKSRELAGDNEMTDKYRKQAVVEANIPDEDKYAALSAFYSSEETLEKIQAAQEEGIPGKEYVRFYVEYNKLEGDKDEDGKTKKEKVIELINSLNLTADQKEWIMEQTYKNVKWWEMPW